MNNEETKILNQEELNKSQEDINKKMSSYEKAAYAGGGFAAGMAAGVGGSAFASNPSKSDEEVLVTDIKEENSENTAEEVQVKEEPTEAQIETQQETVVTEQPEVKEEIHVQDAPDPEEILLATDEGIKVAQVNDSASFGEAFADARAQVGPGGVFEWKGQVYSTYYEEEWSNMSAAERAEFHNKIDYSTIMGSDNSSSHTSQTSHVNSTESSASDHVSQTSYETTTENNHTSTVNEDVPTDTEMVDNSNAPEEIKVLGFESVVDANGNQGTIAGIEVDGHQAILIDVDNNGTMDLIAADLNGNGQIDDAEIQDISQANIEVADLQQMMEAQQNNDVYYASNDDMPDYVNDADISSLA